MYNRTVTNFENTVRAVHSCSFLDPLLLLISLSIEFLIKFRKSQYMYLYAFSGVRHQIMSGH